MPQQTVCRYFRVYIRFGEPIRLDAPLEAAGDQAVVDRLNLQVRGRLQARP